MLPDHCFEGGIQKILLFDFSNTEFGSFSSQSQTLANILFFFPQLPDKINCYGSSPPVWVSKLRTPMPYHNVPGYMCKDMGYPPVSHAFGWQGPLGQSCPTWCTDASSRDFVQGSRGCSRSDATQNDDPKVDKYASKQIEKVTLFEQDVIFLGIECAAGW